ncbi:MAG: carbohydrate-binding family 9-like protein [Pyrinomonadaceae bacterium]
MSRRARVTYIQNEFPISDLDHASWNEGEAVRITTYWSGDHAPPERFFEARLLWSATSLYVRFHAEQFEPLVISPNPVLGTKTHGLWNRDVCEIYIAPDQNDRDRYFEFEVAPTGEWIDLGIQFTPAGRLTDREYSSGMQTAAAIATSSVTTAIAVPWAAFRKMPNVGDVWLGNLCRCVGRDPDRGYLAWQPTETSQPSFHVPSKFGEFEFVSI